MTLEIRDANRYGPLTEERLSQLEAKLNCRLPDDYRSFLLRYNGGRPNLSRFTLEMDDEEQESIVEWFFAVHDQEYDDPEDWEPDSGVMPPFFGQPLEEAWEEFESEQPDSGVLPIARDPCGNLIGIGYAGERVGAVWWYDHETESFVRLAGSFSEFMAGLTQTAAGGLGMVADRGMDERKPAVPWYFSRIGLLAASLGYGALVPIVLRYVIPGFGVFGLFWMGLQVMAVEKLVNMIKNCEIIISSSRNKHINYMGEYNGKVMAHTYSRYFTCFRL